LKIETSFSVDGSVQVETKHLSLSIAPFFNRINNYIYYEKILNNAGADSLIAQTPVYRFTQQSAEMWGLDVNFDLHPHPLDWLHFENTLSYLRGRFTKEVGGSRNMPLIAPLRLLTALRAEFSDGLKFIKNFYIKLEMDNVAAQNHFFAGYNTETATPGYTLFNSGLGGDVAVKGRKTASLFLSVNNITNLAYQNHLSRLKYLDENPLTKRPGVFNMGRNFSVRMMIPLEWKVKNS
ncbi:MAG TPA: TonB-dependent receptor, partial [Niabella sp.]|nr:TonB-dependent receptor [Niabella sp.]